MARLGLNVDHIATVRQARGEGFPDPVEAAKVAVVAGADGITAHLREDRRHIQDQDLFRLKSELKVPLNMEMAATPEIVEMAERVCPEWVCLVPEKRKELTTEGGLDVVRDGAVVGSAIKRLKNRGIRISLFVEPTVNAVQLSKQLGADAVELHTGVYAKLARQGALVAAPELKRIRIAALKGAESGLLVNAGHGIDYDNVAALMSIYSFHELNIGFAIVARALFTGLPQAVKEMKGKMN